MNILGWIFLLTSTLSMTVLVLWCYARVLSAPKPPPKEVEEFHSA